VSTESRKRIPRWANP